MESYDGNYELISHFGKNMTHKGKVTIQTEKGKLSGTASVMMIRAALEDGVINDNRFSFVMRKKIFGKVIAMKVDGAFGDDGTFEAVMRAPFGSSRLEGKRSG